MISEDRLTKDRTTGFLSDCRGFLTPEATFWFKFPFVSREVCVEFHLWSYLRQEKEQTPILSS